MESERRVAKHKAKEIYKLPTKTQTKTKSVDSTDRKEKIWNGYVVLFKRNDVNPWRACIKRFTGK